MAAENSEFIENADTVCRQIFEPRMGEPYPNVSGAAYPSQFQFKENDEGRRVESVVWKQRSSVDACHALGLAKAAADAARKREKVPDTAAEDLPVYVGFFEAAVARIRGEPHADDIYCEPGVFDVEHEPENGVYEHAHIVLRADFLEHLRRAMTGELGDAATRLSERLGRQHAINMLVGVIESNGLTRC